VDDGKVVSSAGITSGVDAALHVVAQRLGIAAAQRVANDLHYPTFNFVIDPAVAQYHATRADSIVFVNMLARVQRPSDGVLLYNGVGELELSSVFDTFVASYATQTRAIAPVRQWLTTQHGLHVLPRFDYASAPALDRLLVPGENAHALAQPEIAAWTARETGVPLTFLHADMAGTFPYQAPLLDLARAENLPAAQNMAKNEEYRPATLDLEGAGWPWIVTVTPLLAGVAGVLVLFGGLRLLARRRTGVAGSVSARRGSEPQRAIST
jgi:hypothetical protein